MELKLGDVQTTALIPLSIKASETLRKHPRIYDPKAVEIIKTLGIDTKPYDKFLSHEGVVARTIMLDRQLMGIIDQRPDVVIVNIGSGFDNRFSRVDNKKILWFDIDLPDAIAARKKAFVERERVTMIAGNALENGWCAEVSKALEGRESTPVFLAEGLLMYFTLDQIKAFVEILRDNFPKGGTLIAELNGKFTLKHEKQHDTLKSTKAHFLSGTDSGQDIVDMTSGIRLVDEHNFNEEMRKHTIGGKLFAALLPNVNNRWATFEWGEVK